MHELSPEKATEKRLLPRQPIAIVRLPDLAYAEQLSRALVDGGVRAIEFTLTNRAAVTTIERLRATLPDGTLIGAGTVLTEEDAHDSIRAGAQFLVTPAYVPPVIECGRTHAVPVVCGAFTPTEILTAWQAGATLVKVFPVGRFGPEYIKDIRGPLPDIPLVPTGGITLDNCASFLDAGAFTVAVGSSLVEPRRIAERDWNGVTELARRFVATCNPTTEKSIK